MLKSFLPIVVLLLCLGSATGQTTGKLVWKSGDELPGRIVSLDNGQLVWQSDKLFKQPLQVAVDYLAEVIVQGPSNSPNPTAGHLVQLMDGSQLFGKVERVTGQKIVFRSNVAGEIELARDEVRSLVANGQSVSASPAKMSLDAWESDRGNKQYWRINSNDQLETVRPNTHIFLKQDFEDSVVVDVEFQWQKNLDFVLGLGVPKNTRRLDDIPRLELWEDSLVFFYNDDFELIIESVDKKAQKLRLTILWDRKNERIVFRDASGKQLTSFACKVPPKTVSDGVFLQNKLGDLIVSSFSIWQAEESFDSSKPAIQLAGENAKNGEVLGFDGTQWEIRVGEGDPTIIDAGKLQAVYLSSVNRGTEEPANRLSFFGDGPVFGDVLSIENGKAKMKIAASKAPIDVSLSGLRKLEWQMSKRAPSQFDSTLVNRKGKVSGELVAGSNEAGDVLRWRMPGVQNAVSFSTGDAQVLLKKEGDRDSARSNRFGQWPDTLYLLNGDIVPCRILGVDETHVKIASFVATDLVPVSEVKAVDVFSNTTTIPVPLDSPAWVLGGVRSQAKRKDEEFVLQDGESLFNPTLMTTRQCKFNIRWRGQGIMSCDFMSDPDSETVAGTARLALYEEAIFVADEEGNPQSEIVEVKSNSATIEIQYLADRILVMINGEKVLGESKLGLAGLGCRLRLASSFGKSPTIKLSQFELQSTRTSGAVQISDERRELLLTIPRLKRNAPPKNIVCARNQDLLRGDVIALNNDTLKIRSGGSVRTFPRKNISSIVWLHADDLGKEQANSASETRNVGAEVPQVEQQAGSRVDAQQIQFVLSRNRRMTVGVTSWQGEHLIGTSQILGDCRIPLTEVQELRMGSYRTGMKDLPYADWIAKLAPAPNLESTPGESGVGPAFGQGSPLIGQTFGRMMLNQMDGKQIRLSEYEGQIVVLDFWATWCGPCITALPKVKSVVESFPEGKVVMLAVNQEESKSQVEQFLERKELELNVVLDSGALARKFLVDAIPQTVVIDGKGKVRFVKVGSTSDMEEKLAAAIEELLPTTEEEAD